MHKQSHPIIVKNLSRYVSDSAGTITILDNVSFEVAAGQSVAITGSSGSGKSTLLGLMAGLELPQAGRVFIMGHDLFALDEDGRAEIRRQHVGFVFQSFQLLPNLTALENVMLPLELAGKPAEAAAKAMLERVGLSERLHHYPRTLSGGEQQRVSLARAFVVEPQIVFADEPTGSLDAENGRRINELMFSMVSEKGATLVLVTHDDQLANRCQHRLRLEGGRLLEI
ncbi:MAG TPA: ABC transporter ATP-binding protein [Burkholderiaceae bacterium]|nr:ABC transporter ATP-binding protein [Burkholderiaceae bacterium]